MKVDEELVVLSKTETFVMEFQDPRIRWNGKDIQSLIGAVACEGDMRFPRPATSQLAHKIDDPHALPDCREILKEFESESLVQAIKGSITEVLSPKAFYHHLGPQNIGYLKFPVPPFFQTWFYYQMKAYPDIWI